MLTYRQLHMCVGNFEGETGRPSTLLVNESDFLDICQRLQQTALDMALGYANGLAVPVDPLREPHSIRWLSFHGCLLIGHPSIPASSVKVYRNSELLGEMVEGKIIRAEPTRCSD